MPESNTSDQCMRVTGVNLWRFCLYDCMYSKSENKTHNPSSS